MLRMLGVICIVLASSGVAYGYVCNLRNEIGQLEEVIGWLHVLEQELSYCRSPLPELFLRLGENLHQPWNLILREMSLQMEQFEQTSVSVVWTEVCRNYRKMIFFKDAEYQKLLQMGDIFSFRSLESSMQLIQLQVEQFSEIAKNRRREYADRRRMCCCVCYLTGFFVIILLF